MRMSVRLLPLAALCVTLSVPAATTRHYSFSNGYPSTTSRQPTSATAGTFGAGAGSASSAQKKDEMKELVGTVTRVDAGDVLWVTPKGGRKTKIVLDGVDAPEQGQPYGVEAKKFLFDLADGKKATVRYRNKDRSGAICGMVYVPHEKGLVEINLTMIKNGCAWAAKSSKSDSFTASRDRAYQAAQDEAKREKRGLWLAQNPTHPAEWRKLRK